MTTSKPMVLNRRHAPDPTRKVAKVYCGRPSKWGNPFPVGEGRWSRQESIWKYFWYLVQTPELVKGVHHLKGYDLECFCKPQECHCDILIQLANDSLLQFRFIHHLSMPRVTEDTYNNHRESLTQEQIHLVQSIMGKVFPSAMQRLIAEQESEADKTAIGREVLELMQANGEVGTIDPEED